jgi:hypothetical protein
VHPKPLTSSALWVANPLVQYHPLSWGDPWYTAHLVNSYQSGEKESDTDTGSVGNSPQYEKWSLHQEWCSALHQLICPMMDYAYPIWRSAICSHIRKLQVLQSTCHHIASNAPWYMGNEQVHEDLGVPIFNDHFRCLTERFDSKLADVENPNLRSSADIYADQAMTWVPYSRVIRINSLSWLTTRGVHVNTLNRNHLALFWLLWPRVFTCIFSSFVRQIPGHNSKRGEWPALFPCKATKFYCK